MIGVHPQIQKFWEKERGSYIINSPTSDLIWAHMKNGLVRIDIAFIYHDGAPTKYYFRGEMYNEAQMLCIIRLKAFL